MSVICFVDGGSTAVSRLAARQLLQFPGRNDSQIGYIACHQGVEELTAQTEPNLPTTALPGRQLIAGVRKLQRSYDHVVLDASGTSDQTIALAVALSDVAITPLCLDGCDHGAFTHVVDLVRIVSENLRRPEMHCVFLAARRHTLRAGTLVRISGLLAMKGLVTVPVPLCGWDHEAVGASARLNERRGTDHSVFTRSIFDLVDRKFTPLAQQHRFG